MVSRGNLVIAIVIPIVIPIGLAMFVFFFALQYKYLKRVRARLEWQEQLARSANQHRRRGGASGLSKYDILRHCPLVIYKGTSHSYLYPNKPIIEQWSSLSCKESESRLDKEEEGQEEQQQVARVSTSMHYNHHHPNDANGHDSRKSEEEPGSMAVRTSTHSLGSNGTNQNDRDDSLKKSAQGDVLVISVISPANNELLKMAKEEAMNVSSTKTDHKGDSNVALLSVKAIPGGVCSICLEEVKKSSRLRLLRCGHAFHATCIERWLGSVNRCPLCNRTVVDRPILATQEPIPATTLQSYTVPSNNNNIPSLVRNAPVPVEEERTAVRGNFFQRIGHWFREAFSDVPPELRNIQLNLPSQPVPSVVVSDEWMENRHSSAYIEEPLEESHQQQQVE